MANGELPNQLALDALTRRYLMFSLLAIIRTYWIAITLFTLSVITLLSLYLQESLPLVPGSDKTHHLIAYCVLMLPTALRKPKYWQFICLFFICFSGVIELLQPYINRHGEWLDMAANTIGIALSLLIARLVNRDILLIKSPK